MRAKTEELIYLLLWSCEKLARPTWRNLDESFEGWAYRTGLYWQLARLEKQRLIEEKVSPINERVHRLTETGRLQALGGRDPETCWERKWDGQWRMVLFDVPVGQDGKRNKLRNYLRRRGFGYLQNSVWVSPHPFAAERPVLASGDIDVESLILLEARPCSGESDAEIVSGSWDFEAINDNYTKYLEALRKRPPGRLDSEQAATEFRRWAQNERNAWAAALSIDPLLPKCLLPAGYLGQKAWEKRCEALTRASEQMKGFPGISNV